MAQRTHFFSGRILLAGLCALLFLWGLFSIPRADALSMKLDPEDPASLSECVTQWFQQRQEFLPRLGCNPAQCALEVKAVTQADPYCALWVAITDSTGRSTALPRTLVLLLEQSGDSYTYLGAGGVAEPFGICCFRREDVVITALAGESDHLPDAAAYCFTLGGQTYTFPLASNGLSLHPVPFSGSMALTDTVILDQAGQPLQTYQ